MWTAEDHAYADKMIARQLANIEPEPLSNFRRRDRKPRPASSHPLDAEIKRLWPMRITMGELARRLGKRDTFVWKRAKRLSLPERWNARGKYQ